MADCLYHGQSSPGPCPQCRNDRDSALRMGPPGYGVGRKWGVTMVPTRNLQRAGQDYSLPFAVLLAQCDWLAVHWVETNQGTLWGHEGHGARTLEAATEKLKISTKWENGAWTASCEGSSLSVTGRTRTEAAWRLFVLHEYGPEVPVPNELLRYIRPGEKPPAELNPGDVDRVSC